jgi:hypothetical protein
MCSWKTLDDDAMNVPIDPGVTPKRAQKRKQAPKGLYRLHLAERVGFEPTIRYNRIPDFESGAFDLSATFPDS